VVRGTKMIALSQASVGSMAKVETIEGGRAMRLRLATLGLREGMDVGVLQSVPGGPVVLEVGSGRLALGAGMAERILVTTEAEASAQEGKKHGFGFARHGCGRGWAGLGVS